MPRRGWEHSRPPHCYAAGSTFARESGRIKGQHSVLSHADPVGTASLASCRSRRHLGCGATPTSLGRTIECFVEGDQQAQVGGDSDSVSSVVASGQGCRVVPGSASSDSALGTRTSIRAGLNHAYSIERQVEPGRFQSPHAAAVSGPRAFRIPPRAAFAHRVPPRWSRRVSANSDREAHRTTLKSP